MTDTTKTTKVNNQWRGKVLVNGPQPLQSHKQYFKIRGSILNQETH